ncbi:GntR family transcriptional regulator [Micromonospora sp. HM5-17]|uniref:GntR family transcriptional regulator n=1 Tax=Micromonospora sp. HM5-17 TaxID=2487710 RepID=UPI000F48574F|nr:UTRA domain-containing protein [Micromonospora sp. HM5-17]ROT29641.1 UTRA domain-containing protein [Micromonospora sp. HM5-17]
MDSQRWTSTSNRYLTPGQGDTWAADAAQSGQRGTQQLLDVGVMLGTNNVTDALGLPAHAEVVIRMRLILADDQPVEIVTSYWPAAIAAGTPLAKRRKIRGGAVTLLAELGYRPATVREDITAAAAADVLDEDQRDMLHLADSDPVLVLARTIYDATGRPYEYTVMVMRAQGRQLTYIRQDG